MPNIDQEDLKESFKLVVEQCIQNGMFNEFCRLNNYETPTQPIHVLIDQATGKIDQIASEFFKFVEEFVFKPMLEKFKETENN